MLAKLKIAILAFALVVGACVSNSLPEGATPEHRYYAAQADYNTAKRVILAYVQMPSTPHYQKLAIAELVTRVDNMIEGFVQIQLAAKASDYESITSEIHKAVLELRIYTAGG